jgi:hypothetical protein
MSDPQTGLTVLAAAIGSKDLIVKVLGPTADYLGAGLKDWTKHRIDNVGRIFTAAARRLGATSASAGVSPRVLAAVLADGSYSSDPLMAEYFGGVLASSSSGVSRDDRGAYFTSILSSLSSYQVRAHYTLYITLRSLYAGTAHKISTHADRQALRTFIPWDSFSRCMAFEEGENFDALMGHALFGLHGAGLIDDNFHYGRHDYLRTIYSGVPGPGVLYHPSVLGIELFLWAHGLGQRHPAGIFSEELQVTPVAELAMPQDAIALGAQQVSPPESTQSE